MKYVKLKYNKLGENGDVVFFLHGYGGNKQSLEKLAKSSCKDNICYLFDLYGFGNTPMPLKCYDIYDYAESIYLFCIDHNIRKLSIVAHSFGGRIAIILGALYDLEIEKIILIDSAGLKPKRNIVYYFNVWRYKIIKKLLKNKQNNEKYGSEEYKKSNTIMRQSYVKIVNQHLDYLTALIRSRTLLLWGNSDRDTPLYMAKKLSENIKNSTLKVYNGGHFVYMTRHSYIKKDVKNFLSNGG